MMTLTIPDDVEHELNIVAKNSQMTPTDFVFSLLQNAFKQQKTESTVSCFDLMQKGLGCIEDVPPDLSTNKRYFEGYGK